MNFCVLKFNNTIEINEDLHIPIILEEPLDAVGEDSDENSYL